ncbi:MAG: hypothetical protein AAFP86_01975 [Planctomycetota bacterium]
MRTLLLGDIGNRLDIEDTERDIERLRRESRSQARTDAAQDERIAALEAQIHSLHLVVGGLSRLLVTRGVLSRDEVERVAEAIEGPGLDRA